MLTVSEYIPYQADILRFAHNFIGFDLGSITVYRQNPLPFVTLSKEIWPGVKYKPTLTHCFFSLLDKKGMLQRVYVSLFVYT